MLKINEAKRLLREKDLSLTQIAGQLGFASVHYLSRMFKNYENMSPTEYMNTIKSKLDER